MGQLSALVAFLKVWLERCLVVSEEFAEAGAFPEKVGFVAYNAFFKLVFDALDFSFSFDLGPTSATLSQNLVLFSRDSVTLLLNDKGLLRPSHRLFRGLSDRLL